MKKNIMKKDRFLMLFLALVAHQSSEVHATLSQMSQMSQELRKAFRKKIDEFVKLGDGVKTTVTNLDNGTLEQSVKSIDDATLGTSVTKLDEATLGKSLTGIDDATDAAKAGKSVAKKIKDWITKQLNTLWTKITNLITTVKQFKFRKAAPAEVAELRNQASMITNDLKELSVIIRNGDLGPADVKKLENQVKNAEDSLLDVQQTLIQQTTVVKPFDNLRSSQSGVNPSQSIVSLKPGVSQADGTSLRQSKSGVNPVDNLLSSQPGVKPSQLNVSPDPVVIKLDSEIKEIQGKLETSFKNKDQADERIIENTKKLKELVAKDDSLRNLFTENDLRPFNLTATINKYISSSKTNVDPTVGTTIDDLFKVMREDFTTVNKTFDEQSSMRAELERLRKLRKNKLIELQKMDALKPNKLVESVAAQPSIVNTGGTQIKELSERIKPSQVIVEAQPSIVKTDVPSSIRVITSKTDAIDSGIAKLITDQTELARIRVEQNRLLTELKSPKNLNLDKTQKNNQFLAIMDDPTYGKKSIEKLQNSIAKQSDALRESIKKVSPESAQVGVSIEKVIENYNSVIKNRPLQAKPKNVDDPSVFDRFFGWGKAVPENKNIVESVAAQPSTSIVNTGGTQINDLPEGMPRNQVTVEAQPGTLNNADPSSPRTSIKVLTKNEVIDSLIAKLKTDQTKLRSIKAEQKRLLKELGENPENLNLTEIEKGQKRKAIMDDPIYGTKNIEKLEANIQQKSIALKKAISEVSPQSAAKKVSLEAAIENYKSVIAAEPFARNEPFGFSQLRN